VVLCVRFRRTLIAAMAVMSVASLSDYSQTLHQRDAPTQPGTPSSSTALSLTETHWNLIEVEGTPVSFASGESQPYIYLQVPGDKLSGSGGCNRLFGSFDVDGGTLQFHSVASTLMACKGNTMQYESSLADALRLTTSFQISGYELSLRVDQRVLARFQAEKAQ
jgi:heat shock protein HslJ